MTLTNPIDELIEKLNALRARATPLPWSWEQCGDKCDAPVVGVSWRDDDETCTSVAGQIQDFDEQGNEVSHYRENIASEWSTGGDGAASANAAFVVEAVNALPILIAALSTLQEQKMELEHIVARREEQLTDERAVSHGLASDYIDLQEQKRKLEEALKPFALAADDLDDDHRDGSGIWEAAAAMSITAGDLRRARALLSGGGE